MPIRVRTNGKCMGQFQNILVELEITRNKNLCKVFNLLANIRKAVGMGKTAVKIGQRTVTKQDLNGESEEIKNGST